MEDSLTGNIFQVNNARYYVDFLHNKPYLINNCCEIINLEWKRSLVARKRSIEGSSENFPMSLLLLKASKPPEVVGHCKISKLPFSDNKVFIQTVVIHPELRGVGLGKFLMKETELLMKRKKIEWIYLTTMDQENFYAKLGYVECPTISIFGCQQNELSENFGSQIVQKIYELPSALLSKISNYGKISPSTPPPPPMPPLASLNSSEQNMSNKQPKSKIFMKKQI